MEPRPVHRFLWALIATGITGTLLPVLFFPLESRLGTDLWGLGIPWIKVLPIWLVRDGTPSHFGLVVELGLAVAFGACIFAAEPPRRPNADDSH